MEWLPTTAGVAAGGFLSWLITHYYHIYQSKTQREELKRFHRVLSEEILEAVKTTEKENLTIAELNQLIEDKAIDKESLGIDPLPYKACPTCGNENLKKTSIQDHKIDEISFVCKCEECGWTDWSQ